MSLWHLRLNLSPPSLTPALRWNWASHTYRAVCLCQWEGWIACTRHLTPRHWGSSKCLINPSVVPPTNRRVKCFQQALGDVWILMHGAASVKVCQFFLSSDLKFLSLLRPLQFMLHCGCFSTADSFLFRYMKCCRCTAECCIIFVEMLTAYWWGSSLHDLYTHGHCSLLVRPKDIIWCS